MCRCSPVGLLRDRRSLCNTSLPHSAPLSQTPLDHDVAAERRGVGSRSAGRLYLPLFEISHLPTDGVQDCSREAIPDQPDITQGVIAQTAQTDHSALLCLNYFVLCDRGFNPSDQCSRC